MLVLCTVHCHNRQIGIFTELELAIKIFRLKELLPQS